MKEKMSIKSTPWVGIKGDPIKPLTLTGSTLDKGGGLRFNEGKLRYDLLHPKALEGITKVMTKGAQKYAERNWEAGMKWSNVMASLKRHIAAIDRGEDFDPETGELHIDHVQCNAHFLSAYYKIYPQGDDRPHSYLNSNKIGLDIDEVLADFVGGMMRKFPEMDKRSIYWNDHFIHKNFKEIVGDEDFWMNLDTIVDELPFEPHCYITSRPVPTEMTKKWLDKNGFPAAPVYTVGSGESKLDVAIQTGIDIFVDDAYHNFVELNKGGVCCFLMDASHNKRYDVGFKRIKSLSELI